ncbi:MAG: polysaccharide deacetylase family protein [Chloroflexi bacterium]|nr:polysaccharide deacetylase family protein [Chloroflexota bacterium]
MFHRVTDEASSSLAEYSVSPQMFAEQMACLAARGYATISLSQVLEHLIQGKPVLPRSVAITFDDGYLDTYSAAFPVLAHHNFTATVFIVADRVGGKAEWDASCEETPAPLMTWAQIREMAAKGICFEAHSCTHPDLTALSAPDAWLEIERPRRVIEEELGVKVRFFAYPHARSNEAVHQLVAQAGYLAAFGARWGPADCTNDVYAINRLLVLRDHDLNYFKWMLELGVEHPWYHQIVKDKRALVRNLLASRLTTRKVPLSQTKL